MQKVLFRYLLVVMYFLCAFYAAIWFYRSAFYSRPDTLVPLPEYPDLSGSLVFLVIIALIFGLKYLIYDSAAYLIRKNHKTRATTTIFVCWYIAVLAFDTLVIFNGYEPVVDAGFVFIGALVYSPPALILGLIPLGIVTFIKPKPRSKNRSM